jgi:phage-related protein
LSTKNPIETEEYYDALEKSAKLSTIALGYVTISDSVAGLAGTNGPTTLADLGTVVTEAVGSMETDVEETADAVGVLGNSSIPDAVGNASEIIVAGLNSLYSGNTAITEAITSSTKTLGSSLDSIVSKMSSLKGSFSSAAGSIASALSSTMYSGIQGIIGAIAGLDLDRKVGGGVKEGTKPTESPIVTPQPTTSTTETPKYPTTKTNLGS